MNIVAKVAADEDSAVQGLHVDVSTMQNIYAGY